MIYSVDNKDSYQDLLSCLQDGLPFTKINGNQFKLNGSQVLELSDEYNKELELHDVIYGINKSSNIVNISVANNKTHIFRETAGVISEEIRPYTHWVLSKAQHNTAFKRLSGDQPYKFIKEYSYEDFQTARKSVYKLNLYTAYTYSENFMIRYGYTYFKNMKIQDVSALSFDIETTGFNAEASDARVLLITNTYRKLGELTAKTFNVEDYASEADMITDWCNWVRLVDPSLIIGHNIVMFDIPYLNTRALINNIQLNLGRNGSDLDIESNARELRKDGSQTYTYHRINCFGRDIVDTFFLAIKYDIGKKYVSYGLKSIIKQEGLEKLGRQHYDASQIKVNWANLEERAKIIQYAEEDSEDPIKLFDLMVPSFFYLTPYIPKTFQIMTESATGSQINALMVRSYLQKGMSVAEGSESVPFEGAVSFGNPGIYNNVYKVDVASLYPSIMRHYKIYPKGKDYNNHFLGMLEYFTLERLKNKQLAKTTGDRFYDDLQNAQKVMINSSYGFMGATRLNYNYPLGAAEVTKYGREIITKSIEWATGRTLERVISKVVNKGKPNEKNEYDWRLGNYVCSGKGYVISNCDTDSISFTTGSDLSVEERKDILDDLNSNFPKSIIFEDDGYFARAIILKAKNYILFDGKKIKIKGSGLKDQKKEPALKEMLDTMINCLVHDKQPNMAGIYNQYIKEACGPQDIMRWSAKKTITKAVLNCANDPDARMNERKPYEAVKDIVGLQEGDKVYLYPCITHERIEQTELKNGKIKETHIKETGLKIASTWNSDEDNEKLVERVIDTVEIFANVFDTDTFIDYSLKKNQPLLETLCQSQP